MTTPATASARGSRRPYERDAEKCNFCRGKKTKCHPHDRNWELGEKCLPCQKGGQPCGPNVRFSGTLQPPQPRTTGSLLPRPSPAPSNLLSVNTIHNEEPQGTERLPDGSNSSAGHVVSEVGPLGDLVNPRSPKLQNVGEKLEQPGNASEISIRLGHLQTIIEHIRALQRSLVPHIDTKEATKIECSLELMVGWIKLTFENGLRNLLTIAETHSVAAKKLIYREACDFTEATGCGKGEFPELRAEILRRLISIYRAEGNLRFVKRLLVELSCLGCVDENVCETQAASDLAKCYEATAAEVGRVFDDIKFTIQPPLHRNPATPFPPVHHALREGNDEVIRLLCEKAATLKDHDMLRQTALIVAAALGKTDLLEPAFRRDPTLLQDRDSLERPALFHAASNGQFDSFSTLAEAGAKLTDRDISSQSILQVAAASGNTATVGYLLEKGVSPNDGRLQLTSPLHEAARKGHVDVCRLLLAKGAWANYRLLAGGQTAKTPGEIAMDHNFPALSALLERATSFPSNDFQYSYQQPQHSPYYHPHQDSRQQSYQHPHLHPQQAHDATLVGNQPSPHEGPRSAMYTHPGNYSGRDPTSSLLPRAPETSRCTSSDRSPRYSHGSGDQMQPTPDTSSNRSLWSNEAAPSSPTVSSSLPQLHELESA